MRVILHPLTSVFCLLCSVYNWPWILSASSSSRGLPEIHARWKSRASTGRSGWSTIPTGAYIWRMGMSGSSRARSRATTARLTTSSSAHRDACHGFVPEGVGRYLPDRVRLVWGAGRGIDRRTGHPAGDELPARHASGGGPARILVRAHGILA